MSSYEYSFSSSSSDAAPVASGMVVSAPVVGLSFSQNDAFSGNSLSLGSSLASGGGSYQSYSSGGGASLGGSASYGAGGASFGASSGSSSGNVSRVANDLLSLAAGGGSSVSGGGSLSLGGGGSLSISGGGAGGIFLSEIEQAILRSTVPINISETEEITVLGQRGIWANRSEVVNWRGEISINEYVINEDQNPEVITKRVSQQLEYVQELAIRYLRPPSPPAPGEIVIIQQGNTLTAPAPPLIIRQQPARPDTPEPLVIREAPPQAPQTVGRKQITIGGKRIPPPPRKVVIERLAPLPAKPQSVLIERWLPYAQVKRRVVFQKAPGPDPVVVKPRNVIVQWEAPQVSIKKEIKYLGVIRANPVEYVQRYGASLKIARDLPQFVLDIKSPDGLVLAADYRYNEVHELEGDLQAFALVDLDREGLSMYRAQLQRLGISFNGGSASASAGGASSSFGFSSSSSAGSSSSYGFSAGGSSSASASSSSAASGAIAQVFAQLDSDKSGSISVSEARRAFLVLNSRLQRSYGEDDVVSFFQALDKDGNGDLNLEEFRAAYERLVGA